MANSNFFDKWTNDIDWGSVRNHGEKLSDVARQNLTIVSAICMISGFLGTGVGLVGNYSPRVSFCDPRTTPCTQIETTLDKIPHGVEPDFIPGYGLQRTVGSIFSFLLFSAGLLAATKAEDEQTELEPQIQLDSQLRTKRLELEANEQLQNMENLALVRVETHEQELREAQAEMFFDRNPHMIEQYLPNVETQSSEVNSEPSELEDKSSELCPEPALEPEIKKIPPGIELMLNSDLREIVDAGILNLIGAQGSGKTTTACMLLRYRIWKGHKLLIVNPHKRKSMYAGLEPHLLHGTSFYGVGVGDEERAFSLMSGLDRILKLISDRYDEYQNLDEGDYTHFPITILLEESAEYEGLLNVFNRPANPKEDDPGFSAKRYLTLFWKKFFIATRKGNCFGIRTLQFDSNTMNGTEGMAELIKSQGACTLTQYSVPDGECVGGWRSTGEAEVKIPNMRDDNGKAVDSKKVKVPTWFEYSKILDPNDFRDLVTVSAKPKTVETQETLQVVESPTPNAQRPTPDDHPDELLRKNLDLILAGLERNVLSLTESEDGDLPVNLPEISDSTEQLKSNEQQPQIQALEGKTASEQDEKRFTPLRLTRTDAIATANKLLAGGLSRTKTIEQLWQVKKSRSGWSAAYREFSKELGL